MEAMLMITPPPWAIICRPAHLQPKKTPLTLMPTTAFQPFGEMSSGLARKEAPALLIMTSRRPKSLTVRSTSPFTASSCRTSTAMARDWRPSFLISAATGSRFSSLRLATTTSAPARANSSAMERPMPTPPPVTMATLFSIENGDAAMTPPVVVLLPRGRGQGDRAAGETTRLYPGGGRRALEAHPLPALGVDEAEPARVQPEATAGGRPAPRGSSADDGMAEARGLHPELVTAPGAQAELQDGRIAAALAHPVMGDGVPAARARADAQPAILDEAAREDALVIAHPPLHHRHIDALHLAGLELCLKVPLGPDRLGEDEEARGLAIQPVDDEGPARRLSGPEIVPEQPVRGVLTLALRGDGQEAGRLVDHEEILVLEDEPEGGREGSRAVTAESDPVRRPDVGPALPDDVAVHLHPSPLEPLLEAAPGGLGKQLAETLEEDHGVPRNTRLQDDLLLPQLADLRGRVAALGEDAVRVLAAQGRRLSHAGCHARELERGADHGNLAKAGVHGALDEPA